MAYDAGTAFLSVVPSMQGVQSKIDAEASKWGVSAGKSFSDSFKRSSDTSGMPIGPSKPESTRQGDASGGAFADGFKRRVEAALKSLPEAKIGAATTEAEQKIRDLRARLEELSTKRVGVDIDAGAATAEISAISAELARLGSESPNIQVKTDTMRAAAELAAIQAEVDRLDGRDANVDVNVDDHGSTARAASSMSGLVAAAATLGPTLIPIGAALAASMAGVATAVGAGAGGLGVLALAFHGIGTAVQAVDKANQSAGASATTSAAAQASAAQQVKAAEESVANARASADSAAIRSAEQVKIARQGVADAERQQAQQAITSAEQVARAQQSLADAERAAANQRITSAESIQRAQESLATTEQSVAAAQVQAARQVESAQRSLTSANQQAADAQKALNDAREQAVRDLEDSANRQADAQLSAQQAALDLTSAQQNAAAVLASSTSTDLQKQQAVLSVAEAQQRLAEAQLEAQRATADNTKTQAAGIDGDKAVVSAQAAIIAALAAQKTAQQNLTDAVAAQAKQQVDGAKQIAAAQQALADTERQANQQRISSTEAVQNAQQALADAQRQRDQQAITSAGQVQRAEQQLADARRNQAEQARQSAYSITQAQNGLTSAQAALGAASTKTSAAATSAAAAMAALSPAGQEFVRFVNGSLKPAFDQLTSAAQAGFLPGFQRGLEAMAPLLPSLTRFVGGLASTMGALAEQAGRALTAPFWRSFFDYVARTAGPTLTTMAHILGDLARGFAGLMMAFAPVSAAIGRGLEGMAASFAKFGTNAGPGSPLHAFIAYVKEVGPQVADTFGAIVDALGRLVTAAAPVGSVVLGVIATLARAISAIPIPVLTALIAGFAAVALATSGVGEALLAVLSPIGLVVAAIAAITAGLVVAYNHNQAFHDSIVGLTNWFTNTLVPVFRNVASVVMAALQTAIKNITDAVDHNHQLFKDLGAFISNVLVPVLGTLAGMLVTSLGVAIAGTITAFGALDTAVRALVKWFRDSFIPFFTVTIPNAFTSLSDWVSGKFSDTWNGVKDIFAGPIHAVVGVFQDIFGKGGTIRSIFSDAVDAIGGIWDKIKTAIATPINWVIENVLNKLIDAVNAVSNALGQGDLLGHIPSIDLGGGKKKANPSGSTANSVHAADGGVLPGWTPGQDVHHFYSPTAGQLHLSGGEAIMRPEWTRAVGGPGAVARMNALARQGIYHFASGGIFRPVRGGVPGPIHDEWTGFPAVDVAVPVGSQVAAGAAGRVTQSYDITGYEPRRPGAQDGYRSYGRVIEILHNGFSTLYAHLSQRAAQVGQVVAGGQIIGLSGDTGNSTGPHLHFGAAGMSPLAFFNGSTDYTGSAGGGGVPSAIKGALGGIGGLLHGVPGGALGLSIAKGLVSTLGGMIKTWTEAQVKAFLSLPGKAVGAVGGALGFADGGVFNPIPAYDSGGFLTPGLQTVYNGTGKPERVLTDSQWDAVAAGGLGGNGGTVMVELTPAQLDAIANRAVILKVDERVMAESVNDFSRERRLHGDPRFAR